MGRDTAWPVRRGHVAGQRDRIARKPATGRRLMSPSRPRFAQRLFGRKPTLVQNGRSTASAKRSANRKKGREAFAAKHPFIRPDSARAQTGLPQCMQESDIAVT